MHEPISIGMPIGGLTVIRSSRLSNEQTQFTTNWIPERHSLSAENNEFDYEIRDKLVGLGTRRRYRAIFTINGDEVFVLTVRAGEQNRLTPDEVDFGDA